MTFIQFLLLLLQISLARLVSAEHFREESHRLLCEQVRTKAQELDLLLPKGNEQRGSLCELPWDASKLINGQVNKGSSEGLDDRGYVANYMVKTGETGQVLIMSSGEGSFSPSLGLDGRRYDIIGGVAQISDDQFKFLSYNAFSVSKNEILFNNFSPVIQFIEDYSFIWLLDGSLLTKKKVVFSKLGDDSDDDDDDGGELRVLYNYLIYRDGGPLKSPYDIRHLRLTQDLVREQDLEELFEFKNIKKCIIRQGIALVRFLQLLNVLRPDHCFQNPDLRKINGRLEILKQGADEETEGERSKEILIEAIKFIQRSADDEDDLEFPFLSILMDREPTIDSIFYGMELPPNPSEEKDGRGGKGKGKGEEYLLGKLLIVAPSSDEKAYHHYKIRGRRSNHDKAVIFCLRAAITQQGTLTTIDIQEEHPNGDEVLRIAHYGVKSKVRIKNHLIRGPQLGPLFRAPGQLFIYQQTSTIEDASIE